MFKALSTALVAASLLAAPVLSGAQAAQPAKTITTTTIAHKPQAKVAIVKHKRYATHPRAHAKHHARIAGHYKWVRHNGKLVKVFVRKPVAARHVTHVRPYTWVKHNGKFVKVYKTTTVKTVRKPNGKVLVKKTVSLKKPVTVKK